MLNIFADFPPRYEHASVRRVHGDVDAREQRRPSQRCYPDAVERRRLRIRRIVRAKEGSELISNGTQVRSARSNYVDARSRLHRPSRRPRRGSFSCDHPLRWLLSRIMAVLER